MIEGNSLLLNIPQCLKIIAKLVIVSFPGGLCNMACNAMGRTVDFLCLLSKTFLTDKIHRITQN